MVWRCKTNKFYYSFEIFNWNFIFIHSDEFVMKIRAAAAAEGKPMELLFKNNWTAQTKAEKFPKEKQKINKNWK